MATREEPLGYHAAQQVERTAALLDLLRKYIDNNQPAGVILTAVLFFTGCSPQERRGVSPIPHNRPASWEYRSFAR